MSTVRALLYAPTPEALETFVLTSGNHPALHLDTTTDTLTFLRLVNSNDIILLHHELFEGAASALTHWINATQTGKHVIIVSVPPDPVTIVHYYEVGAAAYLLTGEPPSALMDVFQLLADGVPRVDGKVGIELLRRVTELQAISQKVQERTYPLHVERHHHQVD